MDAIQEVEMSGEGEVEEVRRGNEAIESRQRNDNKGIDGSRPASLEILDHVNININPESPISTLRGILMSSTADMSFSNEELRKSQELMTQAFVEFYHKLGLLKSYWYDVAFNSIFNNRKWR